MKDQSLTSPLSARCGSNQGGSRALSIRLYTGPSPGPKGNLRSQMSLMSITLRAVAGCAFLLATAPLAQPQSAMNTTQTPESASAPVVPPAPPADPAGEKPSYYAEFGGSYSSLDHDAPAWKDLAIRLGYTGSKRFAPFVTLSSQSRGDASQPNFGAYSYLTINKRLWAVVTASGSPERKVSFYPKLRTGGTLYMNVFPTWRGLFLSAGFTDFRFPRASGGTIASVGAIYYGKVILNGSVNFNHSRPEGANSRSAQAGFQYGREGRYWFGGGGGGGDAAYQLIGVVPLNVRFNSLSANVFYQRWLTRRFGVITRYDYLNEITVFRKNTFYFGLFSTF